MTRWSPHSEATLQASLDDVDWDMFRASSSDVSEFTDVAVSFVNTLTEQATETVTIRTFTNQKPWVDRSIRDAVNNRTAAYNAGLLSGNMSEYKTSCYALQRAIRAAKRRYSEKIESHFQLNDSRRMWQGLKTICSSGNKSSAEVRADPLLAEELNTFYGRFDCNGGANLPNSPSGSSRQSSNDHVITFSEDDVRRELKRVNVRKAAGPDGITGRVLRSCALQRVVRLAERISGSALPSLQHIYLKRCRSRAAKILKDSTHPGNHLFCLLPSGRRFRSMMAKTERLRKSFFPQAIRLLNTNSVS